MSADNEAYKQEKPGDGSIRQEIIDRLKKDPHLDESHIEVEVKNGLAILKGKVDTKEEKSLTENITSSVNGVTGVESHLHIGFGIAHALSVIASHLSGTGKEKDEDKK